MRYGVVLLAVACSVPLTVTAQENVPAVIISLADSSVIQASALASVRLPLTITPGARSGINLAAFQATISWPAAQLRFDSLRTLGGSGMSITANVSRVSDGVLVFNGFSPQGLTAATRIGNAYFTPLRFGDASLDLTVDIAGDEMGRSILSQVRGRHLRLCINQALEASRATCPTSLPAPAAARAGPGHRVRG